MNNAWTWLKRANARAVCASCAIALVLVTAYWAWRLWRPAEMRIPAIPPSTTAPAPSGLNLLDILAQERAMFTNQTARNPFLLPESLIPKVDPVAIVVQADTTPGPERPSASQPPAVPPSKPAAKISLKYQGLLHHDDGTASALIEDSRTRHATFYAAGTNIAGYRVGRIGPEAVEIVHGSQTVTVHRGVATSVEEAPHAD